jgi:predicted dehydrogenase
MTQPVKIGIIGCGNVMAGPYMSLIERLRCRGLVEVVQACDKNEARGRFVLEKFGLANFTTDYRQVIESNEVDLVMVLTSMPEHGLLAHAALEAGKHVLVEKPMAVSLEEAAHLVELARRSPGYLMCAPHIILSPTYRAIWQGGRRRSCSYA